MDGLSSQVSTPSTVRSYVSFPATVRQQRTGIRCRGLGGRTSSVSDIERSDEHVEYLMQTHKHHRWATVRAEGLLVSTAPTNKQQTNSADRCKTGTAAACCCT